MAVKTVLLVHLRKPAPEAAMAHLGLASLAAVLQQAGHRVHVFDEVLYELGREPDLRQVITETSPDVVGFSTYTSTLDRLAAAIPVVRELSEAPILVGGPHATLFAEDMAQRDVDYVVRGEAEAAIVELVERAARQQRPEIIVPPLPDVTELPWPDYWCFRDVENMDTFPIMTSRGCPFACSFCGVRQLSSRRWRPRDPADCVAQIVAALPRLPRVHTINVSDDCPTANLDHFKSFLKLLAEAQVKPVLYVDNMRADMVDRELLEMLRAAGTRLLCYGVESGNAEVFAAIGKSETHEDIRRAVELTREAGLETGLCFVIGLPGDTPQRHLDSIRLAQELRPTHIFWNLAHPYPGTDMHRWFQEHGAEIDPPRAYSSYPCHGLECAPPAVGTPDFTKRQRQRAYFLATIETDQYIMSTWNPWPLFAAGIKYGLPGAALRSYGRRIRRSISRRLSRLRC